MTQTRAFTAASTGTTKTVPRIRNEREANVGCELGKSDVPRHCASNSHTAKPRGLIQETESAVRPDATGGPSEFVRVSIELLSTAVAAGNGGTNVHTMTPATRTAAQAATDALVFMVPNDQVERPPNGVGMAARMHTVSLHPRRRASHLSRSAPTKVR